METKEFFQLAESVELTEHVARAILAEATDGEADWASTDADERADALVLARAAITATLDELTARGWRLMPPDCLPRPTTEHEAMAMMAVAKGYLDGVSRKQKLIVPPAIGLIGKC